MSTHRNSVSQCSSNLFYITWLPHGCATSSHDCFSHDVPVHHILTVQVVQSHDYLWSEEDGSGVVKSVNGAEVSEKFPSSHILQQHVEKPVVMVSPYTVNKTETTSWLFTWGLLENWQLSLLLYCCFFRGGRHISGGHIIIRILIFVHPPEKTQLLLFYYYGFNYFPTKPSWPQG